MKRISVHIFLDILCNYSDGSIKVTNVFKIGCFVVPVTDV